MQNLKKLALKVLNKLSPIMQRKEKLFQEKGKEK